MIGQAFSQSATTFFVGVVLAAVVFGLCRLAGWFYEESLRRKQKRPEPFEPMDFSEEIRVIDRTRRGPDVRSAA